MTSWQCEACPWQWQASHTPLYRFPLTLRKPGMHAWNTQTQSEKVKKRKQVLQCVPWIYLTRGSSISNWTRANFYSWGSLVPINGRVSDLHGEWMKSAHTTQTQTHVSRNEISSAPETYCSIYCCVSTCTQHWALYYKMPGPSRLSDWLKRSRNPFDLLAVHSPPPGSFLEEVWCDWYLVRRGTLAGQTFHQ